MIALALHWVLFPPYLTCSACIIEAPLLCLLDRLPAMSCTSKSVSAPSGIGTGVMFVWRRGSPGGGLCVYNATHSAIWHLIVWKHSCVSTSVVAWYHPLRCQNASWTSPPPSSASMIFPTWLILAVWLSHREAQMPHFNWRQPAQQSRPVQCSIIWWATTCHVSAEIQSLYGCCFGSGWLIVAFNSSN